MVESIAYEHVQVAHNLGVEPELLLNLHRIGQLPATKVGRQTKILIADEDLVTVLRRYLMVGAAKQLNLNQFLEPVTSEVERLSEAILVYLERRYGFGLLQDTVQQMVNKLSRERSSLRIGNPSQRGDAILAKMIDEIKFRLVQRRLARSDRSEAMPGTVHFADAA